MPPNNRRRRGQAGPRHLFEVSHHPEQDTTPNATVASAVIDDAPLAITGRGQVGVVIDSDEYLRLHDAKLVDDGDDLPGAEEHEDAVDAAFDASSSSAGVTSVEPEGEDLNAFVEQRKAQPAVNEQDDSEGSGGEDSSGLDVDDELDCFDAFAQRGRLGQPQPASLRRGSAAITTPPSRPRPAARRVPWPARRYLRPQALRLGRSGGVWGAALAVIVLGIAIAAIADSSSPTSPRRPRVLQAGVASLGNFEPIHSAALGATRALSMLGARIRVTHRAARPRAPARQRRALHHVGHARRRGIPKHAVAAPVAATTTSQAAPTRATQAAAPVGQTPVTTTTPTNTPTTPSAQPAAPSSTPAPSSAPSSSGAPRTPAYGQYGVLGAGHSKGSS